MAQNYVLLERIELNASAASVTFSNIPQTGYTDLKIVISGRDDRASQPNGDFAIQVGYNGTINTGSIYSQRRIYGSPGTGAGSDSSSGTSLALGMLDSSTATANTFGSNEVYIPNFTSSSTYKSVSCDGVSENNASTAFQIMNAGLISTNNPITDIKIFSNLGTILLANSTFSLYGIAAVGTTPAVAPKADGGNVIATDGTYWYHAFLSNGTFTPQVGLSADVLVVAGGGGGGNTGVGTAGGGGAGGLLYFSSQSLTSAQTVTVGAGGAGGGGGTNGVNSSFGSLTAAVGGGRGGSGDQVSYSGGSGGGAFSQGGTITGGAATSGQGYAGGDAIGTYAAGGGGGAGGAGATASGGSAGANGGSGTNTYSSWLSATALGVSGYIAGGGASKSGNTANGGGGTYGVSGTANTGGGGGGNGGATGGSGIIIVRYSVA